MSPRALHFGSAFALLATTATVGAQASGDGFMFRVPTVRFTITTGLAVPRAKSDIFDFVTDELTLSRSDFVGAAVAGSLGVRVTPRVEVGLGLSYLGQAVDSESRRFTGEDDLPIPQTTELHRVPMMASARFSLLEPGRAIGRYAWIPARVVPYVGAGAGPVWYKLRQRGEFVDKETLDIFEDEFVSGGWSLGASGFVGTDVSLGPRYGLSLEGRYLWSKGPMNQDFSTFNKIDLSGYDTSIGLYVRF